MIRSVVVQDEAMAEGQSEEWLAAAVAAHARRVYGIAYRVLRNAPDAEDCVQEVFLRAWRFRSHRERISDEAAWLARIAWRTALDRRSRSRDLPLEVTEDDVRLHGHGPTPEESASDREMVARVEQMIWALPRKLRDPLVLSAWGEMDATEIAAVLETSAASVRSRILRARRMLKKKLVQQTKRAGHEQTG